MRTLEEIKAILTKDVWVPWHPNRGSGEHCLITALGMVGGEVYGQLQAATAACIVSQWNDQQTSVEAIHAMIDRAIELRDSESSTEYIMCDDSGEYTRTLHETGGCDWRCPYCAEDNASLVKTQQEALHRLQSWIDAYPLDVFPEPNFKAVADVLRDNGISLDAVSASNFRHVLKGVSEIISPVITKDTK